MNHPFDIFRVFQHWAWAEHVVVERHVIMVSHKERTLQAFQQRFFSDYDITPPIAVRMQNTGNIIKAVAGGAGVALLPSQPLTAMGLADKLTYLHVDVHEPPMQIGVLYRRGYTLSPIEKAFIAELREAYRAN